MRKVLVVIDMQNDFVTGSLGSKEAEAIVENVIAKVHTYDVENIIVTRDTHDQELYAQSQEGKHLPVEHCVEGTEGWHVVAPLALALEGARVVDKPTFASKELVDILAGFDCNDAIEVELVGLCTDICVVSNALLIKALLPEVKLTVDALCCAGTSKEAHEAALLTMRSCQVNII